MNDAAARVLTRAEIERQCDEWRAAGEVIVFTNGCFDLLHVGHVRYLAEAKSLGDRLVVGVNSDASTRALKGPDRPVNGEADRAEVLASLRCIDAVSIFDELRPDDLIRAVRPNIHTKGGDYRPEDLPEAETVRECGGEVRVLQLVPERSTTRLIEAFRSAAREKT